MLGPNLPEFIILGQDHQLCLCTMFIISMFYLFRVLIFIKIGHIAILRPSDILTILSQFAEVFNFGSRSSIANIIFMINKLDLR